MSTLKGSRFLPYPLTSLLLFFVWLMLNNSLSAGHIVLAIFFAMGIPILTAPLTSPQPTIKKPLLAIYYVLQLVWDIIVSNFQVARMMLKPSAQLQPGFIAVPIDLSTDAAITILASTISLTPGTVSSDISNDNKWLYIHVLHLTDEEELISTIKLRYEKLLKEIFEC